MSPRFCRPAAHASSQESSASPSLWDHPGPPPPRQPRPVGAAVVVGHVSSVADPGVFYRLADLKRGNRIIVTRPTGGSATFRVTHSLRVAKTAFPTQLVYGPVPGRELRLVTCGGAFDSATGHFYDNVIVFATEVGPTS